MATSFNLGGLLGSAFGGGSNALDEFLTPEQRAAMRQQAGLAAAAALLQAAGPSTTRTSLGQALGSALTAGQGGYQRAQESALSQMLTRQKLEEAKTEREAQEAWRRMLTGAPGAASTLTPEQAALAAPVSVAGAVGPTVARANLATQMPTQEAAQMPGQSATPSLMQLLTPEQRSLLGSIGSKQGIPELLKISSAMTEYGKPEPFMTQDGKTVMVQTNKLGQQRVVPDLRPYEPEEFGKAEPFVVNGKTVMMQTNKKGEMRVAPNLQPYEPQSTDIRAVEYIRGAPLAGTGETGIAQVGQYRQQIAPRTPISINTGQSGFENEMKLGGAFKNEPIYKDFSGMESAYGQVVSALKQETPIGDVAGATKLMKLLDPGSVVRESELGIAMAASGRMDRLSNYFNMWKSGEKLTPTQRQEFQSLANELYAASAQAYNSKRKQYEDFGSSYGFKNLGAALGPEAKAPSVMRGGASRRPIGEIFGN